MDRIKLFSMVKCNGYMEKANDGVSIWMYDESGQMCKVCSAVSAIAMRRNKDNGLLEDFEDLSEFSGQTVEKTYYKREEEEFIGCLVGYKRIVATGMIGTDTYGICVGFGDEKSVNCCIKKPKWNPKVGVVYYKNNAKRYVLAEDMEALDGR